jgi:hypothetical protein
MTTSGPLPPTRTWPTDLTRQSTRGNSCGGGASDEAELDHERIGGRFRRQSRRISTNGWRAASISRAMSKIVSDITWDKSRRVRPVVELNLGGNVLKICSDILRFQCEGGLYVTESKCSKD